MTSVFLAVGGEPVLGVCAVGSLSLQPCVGIVLLGVNVLGFGVSGSGVGALLCVDNVGLLVGLGVGVVVFVVVVVYGVSGCCVGGVLVLVLVLDVDVFLVRVLVAARGAVKAALASSTKSNVFGIISGVRVSECMFLARVLGVLC